MVTITSGVERFVQDVQSENSAATETAGPAESAPAFEPSKIDLGYAPFPKQQEFHASPAKYRLFGGAAGPGKSKALLMEAIIQAHEHPARTRCCCAARFPNSSNRCCIISAATFRASFTGISRNRSTWSPGGTVRPRASATARANTTFTNIRARNFFSSASTS